MIVDSSFGDFDLHLFYFYYYYYFFIFFEEGKLTHPNWHQQYH